MESVAATFQHLFDEFATRLEAAGGEALYTDVLENVVSLIRDVTTQAPGEPVWISQPTDLAVPSLAGMLRESGIPHRLPGSPDEIRDAPLGIAVARLAIAETGSVLLHEPGLADRSVSLMTQRLIVLCPAGALVASLDDAAPVLREIASTGPSYATFVTGPSRTADIERELAVGVQGPGVLDVIFFPDTIA
jgi:L-lactate dehydrogenase complex protein LldG